MDSLDVIPYFANVEYIDLDFLGGGGRSEVSEGTKTASSNVCNALSNFLWSEQGSDRILITLTNGYTFMVCVLGTVQAVSCIPWVVPSALEIDGVVTEEIMVVGGRLCDPFSRSLRMVTRRAEAQGKLVSAARDRTITLAVTLSLRRPRLKSGPKSQRQ